MVLKTLSLLILVHICTGGHTHHVSPELRIINGKDAKVHALPSMVFVTVTKDERPFNCGGSLIAAQFVLTAAHCLSDKTSKVKKISLGVHKYDRSDADQTLTASSFVVHEGFAKDTSAAHDIALIKLSAPVALKPGVVEVTKLPAAAAFPDKQDVYVGQQPTMYGWGLINEKDEKPPKVLQQLDGKVAPYKDCKKANRSHETALCMRRLDGLLGVACYGDSGSPLVQGGVQIGVVSGGSTGQWACHRSEFAVFARVDYHRTWIDEKMKKMK